MSISTASSLVPSTAINWMDLQPNIVGMIIHRFNDVVDFINFGATCRTWHSVTQAHLRQRCCHRQKSSQIPWLLLLRPKIERPTPATKKLKRMEPGLTGTVPPLRFYNFSSKKSYFINHPPHLIPDIDIGKVKLIGSDNGYLIYNGCTHEIFNGYQYFVKFHCCGDFEKCSGENSILHFYNPINGTHFSLPPAPVFDRSMVIVNKNPHSNNVIVATVCYGNNATDLDDQKNCIAIIKAGDSIWTPLNLSKIVTDDDFIEDIIFHQERLYIITNNHKMIVFEAINNPLFLSKKYKCMKIPAKKVIYSVDKNELGEETKDECFVTIVKKKLVESPDGKVLFLYVTGIPHLGTHGIRLTFKLFKHDWNQGRRNLVKSTMDDNLSFFNSFDMLTVFWKSQFHVVANCTTGDDIFTGYDASDGGRKRLNIPHNLERAPYMWFIPNLS